MPRQIFVALPVTDVKKSRDFFTSLGFSFNEQFSNATTATMVVSESISVQLHDREHFKTFTPKPVSDATKSTEVTLCLTLDSDDEVKEMVEHATKGGAQLYEEPKDHGFMYHHSFQDLDGHLWELVHWRG